MEMDRVLHMVGGSGEDSYAANSLIQKEGMSKSVAVLTEAIREMCCTNQLGEKIAVADLGCSSGPNTLLLIRNVVITISRCYQQMNRCLPDVRFFMNDLPGNDFNTLFRSIAPFLKELHDDEPGNRDGCKIAPVFVSGVPGSFYGRIFPKNSIHFVHSSFSLQYLSQVPEALQTDEGARLNKRNIYPSKTSSPVVIKSYTDQFQKGLLLFLKSRAEELKVGGRMILLILGRDNADSVIGQSSAVATALAEALSDMVSEGLIEEHSLETFNLPMYFPSLMEMKDVIECEGSFVLRSEEIFKMDWDPFVSDSEIDDVISGKYVAKYLRAAGGTLLANHFRDANMDVVFDKLAEKLADVPREERHFTNLMVHLEKVRG